MSYPGDGSKGTGLCKYDEDFGSGGVLVPTDFTYTGGSDTCSRNNPCSVVITADKQSQLYVANRSNLGHFHSDPNCANDPNNIQCLATPHDASHQKLAPSQGYWASPAYWHYKDSQNQDHYMLYYSATTEKNADLALPPYPISAFSLNASSGPIPDPPTTSTTTLFCKRSPTPSGSWNGTLKDPATAILWAIENPNSNNPGNPTPSCLSAGFTGHAALHAFNATNLLQELYNSRGLLKTGAITSFSTPTVFNGHVYMVTKGEVDVFGLCASQTGGCQ